MPPIIQVENLHKQFHVGNRTIYAVNGASFELAPGEAVALVGESGCGKSTTARCILRLQDPSAGGIFLDGKPIHGLPESRFRPLRQQIQMVFQDPTMSLNPRMTIRQMLSEPLRLHGLASGAALQARILEAMDLVNLDPAFLDRHPRELSGGQKQRVGIARAIITRPRMIVLDEPTSALDMSVKRSIVDLLARLRRELGASYLLITHDLSTVRHLCSRVLVMYLGRIVEAGPTEQIFQRPAHPYTRSLISAIPVPDPRHRRDPFRLHGETPSLTVLPTGCPLKDRCPLVRPACATWTPEMIPLQPGHAAACLLLPESVAASGGE